MAVGQPYDKRKMNKFKHNILILKWETPVTLCIVKKMQSHSFLKEKPLCTMIRSARSCQLTLEVGAILRTHASGHTALPYSFPDTQPPQENQWQHSFMLTGQAKCSLGSTARFEVEGKYINTAYRVTVHCTQQSLCLEQNHSSNTVFCCITFT